MRWAVIAAECCKVRAEQVIALALSLFFRVISSAELRIRVPALSKVTPFVKTFAPVREIELLFEIVVVFETERAVEIEAVEPSINERFSYSFPHANVERDEP